jgi:hypothetical protein
VLFAGLAFGAFHGDSFCRTGNGTQAAGRAIFTAFFIAVEDVYAAPYGSETPAFVRGTVWLGFF